MSVLVIFTISQALSPTYVPPLHSYYIPQITSENLEGPRPRTNARNYPKPRLRYTIKNHMSIAQNS